MSRDLCFYRSTGVEVHNIKSQTLQHLASLLYKDYDVVMIRFGCLSVGSTDNRCGLI